MLPLKNLKEGEFIKMEIRRHWIVYIFIVLYFIFWVIISAFSLITFWFEFFTTMLNIIFWLFFSIFLYVEWLNHELDLYLVTNNRVIWVEQISWMDRNTRECNLWKIQETNSKTKGILSNIFNYGTLSIQTAWTNINNLQMDFCPDTIQQGRKVMNIVDEYRDNEARLKSGMTGEDIHKYNTTLEWKKSI